MYYNITLYCILYILQFENMQTFNQDFALRHSLPEVP